MSKTPIFDSLTPEDQKVINHHVSARSNAWERAAKIEAEHTGESLESPDIIGETERAASILRKNGETAKFMRAAFEAAHPRQKHGKGEVTDYGFSR